MSEFETQVGSPTDEPVKHDIGWYLSAILEDPLEYEPLKAAINDWFTGNDETSLRYKSVIEQYKKNSEELLQLNKKLRASLTDAAHRGQILIDGNHRLREQNNKLAKFVSIAALSSSLFSALMTYTLMAAK